MDARRLKPVMTKRARAVGEREGHNNEITSLNRSNVRADVFDHTYRFMPHHATGLVVLHFLIWPQIAPANACSVNANHSISRLDDFGSGTFSIRTSPALYITVARITVVSKPTIAPISAKLCR